MQAEEEDSDRKERSGERLKHGRGSPADARPERAQDREGPSGGRPCSIADLLIDFRQVTAPLGASMSLSIKRGYIANQVHQLLPKLLNGNMLYAI